MYNTKKDLEFCRMNKIDAIVSGIESVDNLTLVSFKASNQDMKMISLGLNTPISVGSSVVLGVKASNILIAKNLSGMISSSNKLKCSIDNVINGELLSSIKFYIGNVLLESIITSKSSMQMNLKKGDVILALIKASELSILEVNK